MEAEELRAKTADELAQLVMDLRKEQFNARFQRSQGSLENTAQVRKARRAIARLKTILNEKRLAPAKKSAKTTAAKGKKKAA